MSEKPLAWGHRMNNIHDQVGPLHVLKDDGAPACGSAYYTTGGAEHTTGTPAELKKLTGSHATCFRCRKIADKRLKARELVSGLAGKIQIEGRRG